MAGQLRCGRDGKNGSRYPVRRVLLRPASGYPAATNFEPTNHIELLIHHLTGWHR